MQFSGIKIVLALPLLLSPLTSALSSSMMGMSSSSASTTSLPASATLTVVPGLSNTMSGMYPIIANTTSPSMSTETSPIVKSNATVVVTGFTVVTGSSSPTTTGPTTSSTAKPTSAASDNLFYQKNAMVALGVAVMASAVMTAIMA